jgi:hypothetical protein
MSPLPVGSLERKRELKELCGWVLGALLSSLLLIGTLPLIGLARSTQWIVTLFLLLNLAATLYFIFGTCRSVSRLLK